MTTSLPSFPHRFQLSEYACAWLGSGERNDDDEETGGFVCVRVAQTGDDTQDWLESDVYAATFEQAQEIARGLIEQHEDEQSEFPLSREAITALATKDVAWSNREDIRSGHARRVASMVLTEWRGVSHPFTGTGRVKIEDSDEEILADALVEMLAALDGAQETE